MAKALAEEVSIMIQRTERLQFLSFQIRCDGPCRFVYEINSLHIKAKV